MYDTARRIIPHPRIFLCNKLCSKFICFVYGIVMCLVYETEAFFYAATENSIFELQQKKTIKELFPYVYIKFVNLPKTGSLNVISPGKF